MLQSHFFPPPSLIPSHILPESLAVLTRTQSSPKLWIPPQAELSLIFQNGLRSKSILKKKGLIRVHMQPISIEIKRKLVSSKPYLMLTLFVSSVWSDQRMGYIFFFDRSGIDLKILDLTLKSSRFLESLPVKILMEREWQFNPPVGDVWLHIMSKEYAIC